MHNERNGVMTENKKKYAYWMHPSLVEEMEEMLKDANADSKSEFVTQAVRFYIGYLRQGKNVDYLAPILSQSIKEEISGLETNLSRMLFKLAVEVGMTSHLHAVSMNVSEDTLEDLRNMCAKDVAQTNGIIEFEDAYRFQKG